MGLFERSRVDERTGRQGAKSKDGASEREALRLIDEGNVCEDEGRIDVALQRYEAAIRLAPDLARGHLNLGNARMLLGDTEGAVNAFTEALVRNPDYAAAHYNMGNAYARSGQSDAALGAYRKAIRLNPDFADAEVALGGVLEQLGQYEEAVASYRRAVAINPGYAAAHCNLGSALKQLGRYDDAAVSYRRALEIAPDFVEAHSNLGTTLRDLGQTDEAVASFRRALEINSTIPEVHYNLGKALKDLGQLDGAMASYRRALEIKPDFALAYYNLANAQRELRLPGDAVASYHKALEINDNYFEAHNNLGNALNDLGRLDDAVASYCRALEIEPDFPMALSNLLFCRSHSEGVGPDLLFAEHCRFGEQFEAPLRAGWPVHGNVRDPDRCLRVGFVSGDLRDHAVAYFIEPLLAHLARSTTLVLHAYYNHAVEGNATPRLRTSFKHWHAIAGLSDAALAREIGDDEIDILIDLSGHTGENRLLCFARKPAPVQASWMGYPGTTGLNAMDYYIADRYFLPPGAFDNQFTEKLVYLPASAPFLPDQNAPAVNSLPALRNGYVTFGSFNRLSKLTPSAIALWSRLLRALPNSRMLIGGMPEDGRYDTLIDWFAREGIARDRLSFHRRCSTLAYLILHHQVDICLDTFPYTGGTTTSHAICMGVPTLSLAGHTAPGRQGAAILGHVGLNDFIAKDAADFERKGLYWASDLAALAGVRAGLRERYNRSPLRDPGAIAAGLERALRAMWQRWCAGLPAESIDMSLSPNEASRKA